MGKGSAVIKGGPLGLNPRGPGYLGFVSEPADPWLCYEIQAVYCLRRLPVVMVILAKAFEPYEPVGALIVH